MPHSSLLQVRAFSSQKDDNSSYNGAYWDDHYEERFGRPPSPLMTLLKNNQAIQSEATSDVFESGTSQPALTHTDQSGKATMVDVSDKTSTHRVAVASGRVILGETAFNLVQSNASKKGDVLAVARIAGIMAAKSTANLIPLCHNIPLSKVRVDFTLDDGEFAVNILAEARTTGVTGVEMEALTAVSVAALTVYDMCKAVTHDIAITDVKLDMKTGGKSDYEVKTSSG